MRKWNDVHPHRNNKKLLQNQQRLKKRFVYNRRGKKSIPLMGWFRDSGAVEILNVRWPFITWISKEGKFDLWIKLQKLHAFKEKCNRQIICWYYIKSLLFIQNIFMPKISSCIHLFRISNINQIWFRACKKNEEIT